MYNAEYVLINEAQFFSNLKNWVLYAKNTLNKNVIVSGLELNYKRQKFGQILDLTINATKTFRMLGKCKYCSNASLYTHRIVNNESLVLIGSDEYVPLCEECWNKKKFLFKR